MRDTRRVRRVVTGVLAVALVVAVLLLPDSFGAIGPLAFLRIPGEGVLLAAALLVLPRRAGRVLAVLAGLLLGVLTVVKLLDGAIGLSLKRPFDPVTDLGQLGSGAGVVADALGVSTTVVIVAAVVLVLVLLAALVAATLRLAGLVALRRPRSAVVLAALAAVWVVLAVTRVAVVPGAPLASVDEAGFGVVTASRAVASAAALREFDTTLSQPDAVATAPGQLAALRGKDVLVVFVEAYGQVAVQGTAYSKAVDRSLAADEGTLAAAGFSSRSGTLVSPTFGGISWLAHSTLESGVWVPNQSDYDRLLSTHRRTLTRVFHDAGWRTVSDAPSDAGSWPAGQRFYAFDRMYSAGDVGYAGPRFSYARIPDQWTLARFGQLELGAGHAPVMAEIDLVSSHTPWTPLPRTVAPSALGDGSVYDPMPAQGVPPSIAWQDPKRVQALYGQSIQYAVRSVTDFVAQAHDPDLVVLMLGDHQPSEEVSGADANHDVPVSLIAADPAVLRATDAWDWTSGLRPAVDGPVWRMDALRDRFLDAYRG